MKKVIFSTLLFFQITLLFGQIKTGLTLAIGRNYADKFHESSFVVGVPFSVSGKHIQVSIGFEYARKNIITHTAEPIRTEIKDLGAGCTSFIFCATDTLKLKFYDAKQVKMDYLQVPFDVKIFFSKHERWFLDFGLYAALAVNGKISHYEFYEQDNISTGNHFSPPRYQTTAPYQKLSFGKEHISRWDLGTCFGFGFQQNGLAFSCRFENGFLNLNTDIAYKKMRNASVLFHMSTSLYRFEKKTL